jgi:arylsulfatase A-like enzyme
MNSTQLADRVIAQLEKEHERPFFLACGFFNPHMPWYVPQRYFDMFPLDNVVTPPVLENDLADVPPAGVNLTARKGRYVDAIMQAGLHKEGVRAYLATTAYVDFHMGRILDALEKSRHRNHTLVVFLTDHGFHLGEKHHWQKATLWEEATHSLLMFRVPGITPAGGVSRRFVSLQDIYPTLVDLCGLEHPDYLDGRSLVPLLKQPDAPWPSTAITCLTDKGSPEKGFVTIRNQQGRYIRYGQGQEEFYDAIKDPHEWTNEINNADYAEVIAQMRAAVPAVADMAVPLPFLLESRNPPTGNKRTQR